MSNKNRTYVGLAICVIVIWHLAIAFSENKKIAGPFSAIPKPGYVWSDGSTLSRFFWNGMKAEWQSGLSHPTYKAVSSFIKNSWAPLPGYAYTGGSDLSSIRWQPGLTHPTYKIVSNFEEGQWIAELGYQFKHPGISLEVVWTPGLNYNELKMIAGNQPDEWIPYPGYEISKDGNIFKPKWKEGLLNPNNNEQISGEDENEWLSIDELFEDASYSVSVAFPGCNYTTLTKVLYQSFRAFNPTSNLVEKVFADNLLQGSRTLMDELIGGMLIPGTITITKNYLEYEPNEYVSWFISGDNIQKFRIPATAIKFVERNDYALVGVVTIKTEFTTINFTKSGTILTQPGSTIRDKIDLMLKYNHITY